MSFKGLEPANSCVRDQSATTAPVRHMLEAGYLNWGQFSDLSNSLNSPKSLNSLKVLLHLEKNSCKINDERITLATIKQNFWKVESLIFDFSLNVFIEFDDFFAGYHGWLRDSVTWPVT